MRSKILTFVLITTAAFLFSCKTAEKKHGKKDVVKEEKVINGPGRILWDDGSVKGTGNFKDAKKDGKWVLFQKGTGENLAEGEYINDMQNGQWVYYHKNGEKSSEGAFEDNQKTGQWIAYYESGAKLSEAKYVIRNTDAGKISGIEGIKTTYYESGKVKQSEEYVNGEKKGKNQEFFESGNPREISWFTNDKHNGKCNVYWETGKAKEQGFYQDDLKNGEWKFFYDSGQPQASGSFIIGKLTIKGEEQIVSQMNGRWQFYSREGLLQKEGDYDRNKETGLWRLYSYQNNQKRLLGMELTLKGGMAGGIGKIYENGILSGMGEMMGAVKGIYDKYVNGRKEGEEFFMETPMDNPAEKITYKWSSKWKLPQKNGPWTEYYPNGKSIKIETAYMMDKLNGKYIEYYPNGSVKAEGEYMFNKKNGLWKVYNEKGVLVEEESGRWMMGKKSEI